MNRQVTVFDPFRMLSDDFFGRAGDFFNNLPVNFPMDVEEGDDHFVIKVAVPGFSKNDIKIDIEDRTITISANIAEQTEDKGKDRKVLRKEIVNRSFSNSYTLPTKVDAESAKALFKDGILKIELPKAPEVMPKKIDIEVG